MVVAMLALRISVEGERVVDRRIRALEGRATDVAAAWPAVIQVFRAIMARVFATEGASTGVAWPQLALTTQQDRARHGYPPAHPILQRTTALRRALAEGVGALTRTSARRMSVAVGPDVEYFVYHQSARPRRRLPRRAPVLLTADDRTALVHPVRLYVTGHDPNARRRAPIL